MFKKAIAGVLSAVLCASALLSGGVPVSREAAMQPEQAPAAQEPSGEGVQGTNSLSRFLTQQPVDNLAAAQPLKAVAAEGFFAVTGLDYDAETGLIRAVTSQSEDCTLLVMFADEDNPANVYKTEFAVRAGEYVTTEGSADLSRVPAYFTITAQLVDRIGNPLGEVFRLTTHTREIQEIIEKTVSDFAPEQVVNLDEDENTNFIVLTEDTVQPETDADTNTLISADYDQNVFVFGNIDNSFRSLNEGQYLYIQPTEDDIIAVSVQDVTVDGDTATVTGSDEIDDMFDFIKMEVEATSEYETQLSDRQFRDGNVELVSADDLIDPDIEPSEFTLSKSFSKELSLGAHFSVTPGVSIESTVKWNAYKHFSHFNVFFVAETSVKLSVTASASTAADDDDDEEENNNSGSSSGDSSSSGSSSGGSSSSGETSSSGDNSSDGSSSGDSSSGNSGRINTGNMEFGGEGALFSEDDHLIEVPIPLPTSAALQLKAFVDLNLYINAEIEFSVEKKFTKGFAFDSQEGMFKINFDSEPVLGKVNFKGSVTAKFKVGFEVEALGGLVSASVGGGLSMEASLDTDNNEHCEKDENGSNIFKPQSGSGPDKIHFDDTCMKIEIGFKVSVELEFKVGFTIKDAKGILKVLNGAELEKKFSYEYETDEILGHKLPKYVLFVSLNSAGDYKGISFKYIRVPDDGEAECPHQAYKVDFKTHFYNVPAGTSAELIVDGHSYPLSPIPNSVLTLYAIPRKNNGSYSYAIMVDNVRRASGTFYIDNAPRVFENTILWDEDGNYTGADVQPSDDHAPEPAVTTPPETIPYNPDYSDHIPPKYMITKGKDYIWFGDSITGLYSNDGTLSICGFGDMYDEVNLSYDVRQGTRTIIMQDLNPEKNLFINSLAAKVFSSMPNLEVVYMPHRITKIGARAFEGDENLKYLRYGGEKDTTTTFVIPSVLRTVGDFAFKGCKSAPFGDIKFAKSVSSIGYQAFEGCLGITSIDVPGDSEATIGTEAFAGCSNLKKAVFNKGVKQIAAYCLGGCSALEDLTLPFFDIDPAEDPGRLVNLFNPHGAPEGFYLVYTNWRSISYHVDLYAPSSLKHVTILTGDTVPGSFFNNFKYLETITICGEVTEIGESAFTDCASLKELYFGTKGVNNKVTALPQGITVINPRTFCGCTNLNFADLTIPSGVTAIKDSAFTGCCGITSLYVPGMTDAEKTPVTTIGSYAFNTCKGLKKIQLGDGVKSLGGDLFNDCISVSELQIPRFDLAGAVCDWFSDSDYNYPEELYLGYSYPRMMGGSDCAFIPKTLKKIVVTGGTVIPRDYFRYLKSVETIECRGDIETIEQDAFNGCESLEMIRLGEHGSPEYILLPDSLTTVGEGAFRGCTAAKFGDLAIPETLVSVGASAFNGCKGITSLVVPGNGETVLSGSAFSGCTNLKKAVIWDGVKTVSGCIFANCLSMEELVVGSYDQFGTAYDFFNRSNDYPDDMYMAYSFTNMFGHTESAFVPKSMKIIAVARGGNIAGYKFDGMKGIETFILPLVPETVDNYAFQNCTAMKNLNLIGEAGDWNEVTIRDGGNSALLTLLGEDRAGGSYDPLQILAQPDDAVVYTGTKTTFYCMAAGKYELHYHWQYTDDNGTTWNDAGSSEFKLTVTADKAADGRKYRCVVEDVKQHRVISDAVTLTVRKDNSGDKPAGYHPGDLNGDGQIDVSDAVLLARFVAEDSSAKISSVGILNADVDGNGNAGSEDIVLILQFIAKRIKVFPVDD